MSDPNLCKIDGCSKSRYARGWCSRHYERWRRAGDAIHTKITPPGVALQWLREAIKDPGSECILWPFAAACGYGVVKFGGRYVKAHRLALALHMGVEIPPAAVQCLHAPVTCHNRLCVNPLHLRWGTAADNSADMSADGTVRRGQANGRARLTSADVVAIRADTRSRNAIARHYGIGTTTVGHILHRRTWKEI